MIGVIAAKTREGTQKADLPEGLMTSITKVDDLLMVIVDGLQMIHMENLLGAVGERLNVRFLPQSAQIDPWKGPLPVLKPVERHIVPKAETPLKRRKRIVEDDEKNAIVETD